MFILSTTMTWMIQHGNFQVVMNWINLRSYTTQLCYLKYRQRNYERRRTKHPDKPLPL